LVQAMLPRLERDLLRVVFLVNNRLTLADLAMFAAVRPYVEKFNDGQKKTFVNICRWFDFIQHQEQTISAKIPLIDLHFLSQVYSLTLTESKNEQAASLLAGKKATAAPESRVTALPDGIQAPYPDGQQRPLFGFAFVNSLDAKGLFVTLVLEGQSAAIAGLQASDVITDVDGKPTNDRKEFFSVLKSVTPGQSVPFKYVRNGKSHTTIVKSGFGLSSIVIDAKKKPEEKEEAIVDKQKESKKHQSKQTGKSDHPEAKKKEPPAESAKKESAPQAESSEVSAADAVAEQGNIVRDLKARKAPLEEINAAVAVLKKLKHEAGIDTGGKKKK